MKVVNRNLEVGMFGFINAKVLLVEESDVDKATLCENCLKPFWSHPDLARDVNEDWCLNCNDEGLMKTGWTGNCFAPMTDQDFAIWSLMQITRGMIICVVTDFDPESVIVTRGGEEE
mgnify:CR=1 FL=1